MNFSDFKEIFENSNEYLSNDKFWFENEKVQFWYKICVKTFTYQPNGALQLVNTKYKVLLIVDDTSLNENYKDCVAKDTICGFTLKECEKKGNMKIDDFEKIVNSALKIKIENKIKVDKYSRILGLLNGDNFKVKFQL